MNELTVTVRPAAPKAGENITLTAQMEHALPLESWEWKRKEKSSSRSIPLAGQTSDICTDIAVAGDWTYEANAKDSSGRQVNGAADVHVAPNAPEVGTPHLSWKPSFAWAVGVALLGLLGLFVWWGGLLNLSVSLGEEVLKTDPRAALAAKVIGPVLAAAAMLLLTGLWMALVEWRSTFDAVNRGGTQSKGPLDIVEIAKAVGGLKGASLVFVGGLVLVLSVAWMVGATAGSDATAGATEPTASASASATPR